MGRGEAKLEYSGNLFPLHRHIKFGNKLIGSVREQKKGPVIVEK